jgi:hypothetical protein
VDGGDRTRRPRADDRDVVLVQEMQLRPY